MGSLCLQLRVAGAFSLGSCPLSTHHYYTTLHTNCGLASVFTSSDPYRNGPPPPSPSLQRHQSLTTSHNSPTHFELQTALRPCGGGLGVEQVWIKFSKNPTEHYYGLLSSAFFPVIFLSDSDIYPHRYFDLLLPPPVHRSELSSR